MKIRSQEKADNFFLRIATLLLKKLFRTEAIIFHEKILKHRNMTQPHKKRLVLLTRHMYSYVF